MSLLTGIRKSIVVSVWGSVIQEPLLMLRNIFYFKQQKSSVAPDLVITKDTTFINSLSSLSEAHCMMRAKRALHKAARAKFKSKIISMLFLIKELRLEPLMQQIKAISVR